MMSEWRWQVVVAMTEVIVVVVKCWWLKVVDVETVCVYVDPWESAEDQASSGGRAAGTDWAPARHWSDEGGGDHAQEG